MLRWRKIQRSDGENVSGHSLYGSGMYEFANYNYITKEIKQTSAEIIII